MSDVDNELVFRRGTITVRGEFLWGSNYTFLATVSYEGQTLSAVYKPVRGERPLWDFPAGTLAKREVAAYLVSEILGWGLVPLTVFRRSGPLGAGSLQRFVDHNPDYHYFNFSTEDRQRLRPVMLFDMLINNADRKGSHILLDNDRNLWLIDHGVSFHVDYKLRTVVWDFIDEPIPENLVKDLRRLVELLHPVSQAPVSKYVKELYQRLSLPEIKALRLRALRLVEGERFPAPRMGYRPYPWPQI